jgi:hypothetical protein
VQAPAESDRQACVLLSCACACADFVLRSGAPEACRAVVAGLFAELGADVLGHLTGAENQGADVKETATVLLLGVKLFVPAQARRALTAPQRVAFHANAPSEGCACFALSLTVEYCVLVVVPIVQSLRLSASSAAGRAAGGAGLAAHAGSDPAAGVTASRRVGARLAALPWPGEPPTRRPCALPSSFLF